MNVTTDLALELRESRMASRAERDRGEIDGVTFSEHADGGVVVSTIDILNEAGEEKLGRRRGRYVTVSFGDVSAVGFDEYCHICRVISKNILSLSERICKSVSSVLVCGLGNRRFAADAVGVISAERTVITRHIKTSDAEVFRAAGFFDVCAFMPGVAAQTGLETLGLVKGAAENAKPDLIIVIDSLAARETERLARTVQITDTGISPGSGVGNHRAAINSETTGFPTIALGVPMVIDSNTLLCDALENAGAKIPEQLPPGMFVCPKDVDTKAELVGGIIGYAINLAFHKNMTIPEMMIM